MFLRTRTRIWGVAAALSGPITAVTFALLRSFSDWRARWQAIFAIALLITLLFTFYVILLLLTPLLIRWLAKEELKHEQLEISKQVIRTLLAGESPYFPYEEDLVKREASRSIERALPLGQVALQDPLKRIEEYKSEIEHLRSYENESKSFNQSLRENTRVWTVTDNLVQPKTEDSSMQASQDVQIEDPIHQQVSIEGRIAPIFYHPIVQRLAHIKQLSFSYLTFPTATHSRLSHSLGVCKNAELALRSMLQKGIVFTPEGTKEITLEEKDQRNLVLKTKVAALLHDVGHTPFGHGLDQYISTLIDDPSPDKFFGKDIIREHLAEAIQLSNLDVDAILLLLDKTQRTELESYDNLASEIIDSPIDVDRMDYLVRDAHMTGLSLGTINVQALIARMIPFEETSTDGIETKTKVSLVFHPSAIPYITHFLYARDSMYLNCYEHPMKMAAEKMLIRAVQDFRTRHKFETKDLILATDEQLLRLLLEHSAPSDPCYKYASALMRNVLFEEILTVYPKKWEKWKNRSNSDSAKQERHLQADAREEPTAPLRPSEAIESWIKVSLNPKLSFDSRPKEWEEAIFKRAGLDESDEWKVFVTVPSPAMYEPKYDQIKILTETNKGYGYRMWDDMTGFWEDVLQHIGVDRFCIRVFASPDLGKETKEKIRSAAQETLTLLESPSSIDS